MTVPPIVPELLEKVRAGYLHQEPTAIRLQIAAHNTALGPAYLKQALALSPKPLRELLFDMFDYEPQEPEEGDDPEPDYRAPAAQLFLYGVEAGNWTATAREIEQARAQIIARYGSEAFNMLAPEKTKDDLAREAGVPNKTFVHKPANKYPLLQPKAPTLSGEDQRRYETVQRMQCNCAAILHSDASDREKLHAIQRLLASVEMVRPDIQGMWRVQFVEYLAVLREMAWRFWQRIAEAESK